MKKYISIILILLSILLLFGYNKKRFSEPNQNNEESKIEEVENKKINILWLGTSIPYGNRYGNYPEIVGDLLGDNVTVYNISASASIARTGSFYYQSGDDSLGISGFQHNIRYIMKSLGISKTEKQSILDNWDYWSTVFTYTEDFDSLFNEDKNELYMSCSYDGKLKDYLEKYDIDYVVYDMGYNDTDVYDYSNTDEITEIPTEHNDRTYYIGASEFIFNKIYEYSPETKIIIAGHYSDEDKPYLCIAQQELADYMNVPIYKTWEETGWTNELVTTTGYWDNGYWIPNGGEEREITLLQLWLPDGIHPGNDYSQKANNYLAKIHAKYLKPLIFGE